MGKMEKEDLEQAEAEKMDLDNPVEEEKPVAYFVPIEEKAETSKTIPQFEEPPSKPVNYFVPLDKETIDTKVPKFDPAAGKPLKYFVPLEEKKSISGRVPQFEPSPGKPMKYFVPLEEEKTFSKKIPSFKLPPVPTENEKETLAEEAPKRRTPRRSTSNRVNYAVMNTGFMEEEVDPKKGVVKDQDYVEKKRTPVRRSPRKRVSNVS